MFQKKEFWILIPLFTLFLLAIGLSVWQKPRPENGAAISFSEHRIAVINLQGPISFSEANSVFQSDGVEGVIDELEAAENDHKIKGILLKINSPGGTVAASQELYSAILRVKKQRHIPVYVSIGDVGASGAYMAAIAADKIYANEGSLVGSIGVIFQNLDLSELKTRYGIGMNTIKSGRYKDLLSSWKKQDPEEVDLLQGMLNDIHTQFKTAVQTQRHLSKSQVDTLATGQVFTGNQAKKLGLIDETGTYYDAITALAKKVGVEPDQVTSKQKLNLQHFIQSLGMRFHLATDLPIRLSL